MILLENIDKEDRRNLLSNIEYYSYLKYTTPKNLENVVSNLINEFGAKYAQEIWLILSFSARAVRYSTKGFQISLDRNHYTSANKLFHQHLYVKRMRELLEMMDSAGYITFYLGFHNHNDACLSAVILGSIIKLIPLPAKTYAMSRNDILNNIEIVDTEKSTIEKTFKFGVCNSIHKDKVFKTTKGVAGIAQLKEDLYKYNKLIENTTISIDNNPENCVIYKRRFEDNLSGCGRYYAPIQNYESNLRKTITINGNNTCELDYSTCHPRIIAETKNIKLPYNFDAYDINGIPRNIAKKMLFPVLFSKNRGGAKAAITRILKENCITDIKSEQILKLFTDHNDYMKDMFFNHYGYQILQNYDSKIASYVINYFTNKGIVVLCYHDSFVIEAKYLNDLQIVMQEAWCVILGGADNCKIKIEYNN